MPASASVQSPAKLIRLIHLALMMGLTVIAGVMVAIKRSPGGLPSSAPDAQIYLLMGFAVLSMALGLVFLRPKIANRGSDQSPDAYWSERQRAAALIVWAQLEGAGLL